MGKPRTVVSADDAAGGGGGGAAAPNAFELERAARIAKNQAAMLALGLRDAAATVTAGAAGATGGGAVVQLPRSSHKRQRREPAEQAPQRVVRSRRLQARRGEAPDGGGPDTPPGEGEALPAPPDDPDADALGRLLTCDEYCDLRGLPKGPQMDGHFRGWVEEGEAWEQNGGGKFDRKAPKGTSAKEFARAQLRKNPNAYFYRHNVPGEDTWQGEWGEDEVARFVAVATQHGCGDKWGLFASYIPHRVGYQCSAAYRHIIIPRGLLRDDQFRLTASGEAIYVAARGRGGRGGGGEEDA